jgi:hypothetical protein
MSGGWAVWLWKQLVWKYSLGVFLGENPKSDPIADCPCSWCQASREYLAAIHQLGKSRE